MKTDNPYIEHEKVYKELIFELIDLYGSPSTWDEEVREIFKDEVQRRIKEDGKFGPRKNKP